MSAGFYTLTAESAAAMAQSYVWDAPCGWRERFGAWLILMAQKVVGFDSEEAFERARQAILSVERSGIDRQPHRGRWGGDTFGRVIIGKSNSAITKGTGSANNVSVWDGATQGSESDTTDDITAWNYFGDIASGKWVAVVETVRGYVIIAAEC